MKKWIAFAIVLICSSASGSAQDQAALFSEPKPVTLVLDTVNGLLGNGKDLDKSGFYPAFDKMVSGAGWISLGPGYRRRVFGNRAVVDASAAVSWRAYKRAQLRFEFPDLSSDRLSLGTQIAWQDVTQLHYFGPGPASIADMRTAYRLKTSEVSGYATYRPSPWLAVSAIAGRIDRPTLDSATGPFDGDLPYSRDVFPADPALSLPRQPSFAHIGLALTADSRDHADHPTRGGMYEFAWSRYADLDLDRFGFSRYEAEAAHLVPMLHDAVVFAFHGWTVLSDTAGDQTVPVYLMPSLGGSNTLRAYSNFRFHDRHLLLATAEARIAMTAQIDTAVFVDAGSVAPDIAGLRLGNRSYGIGLRFHTYARTTMRIDAAHGREGWRLMFSLSDPLRLRRLERHTAAIPFVP